MPHNVTVSVNAAAFGQQYTDDQSTTADVGIPASPSVPAAKTGNLTTRTSDTVGTLTMDTGHGITTGAEFDLFWDNGDGTYGMRANITAGTVSGDSVPFTLGTGDNLPGDESEIFTQLPVSESTIVTGDDLVAFGFRSNDSPAIFTVFESDGTTLLLTVRLQPNASYIWNENNGVTNPLAGADIAITRFSHGNSDAAETLNGFFAYD